MWSSFLLRNDDVIGQFNVTTLPEAIEKEKHIFIAFCTPWCSYCNKVGYELRSSESVMHRQILWKIHSQQTFAFLFNVHHNGNFGIGK